MAGTNRNQILLLSEAWKRYWSELFPGGVGWRADLESEIRRRLYFPGDVSGFPSIEQPEKPAPSWAKNLEVDFQGNSVAIGYLGKETVNIALFSDQLVPVFRNSANNEPLDKANSLPELADRGPAAYRDFLTAVVRSCGNGIRGHLLRALKETETPRFEIHCRPHDAAFTEVKELPLSGLSAFRGIDIEQNELTDSLRLPILSDVHLVLRNQSEAEIIASKSFDKDDDILIEEMKSLIDATAENSVRQAAVAVLAKARRLGNASDDSVQQRLQQKFSKKYPRYIAEKSRAGLGPKI